MQRRRVRATRVSFPGTLWILAGLLLTGLLLGGCERQGFRFTVTFPGPLDVKEGALVRYQGVPVGGVTGVSLAQNAPAEPGRVELSVVIDDSDVVLREDDVFEVTSDGLLGESYLRITPAPEASPPLAPGARVAGRPPLATRVVETAEEALARLGVVAREQAELLVERLSEQFEDRSLRPEELGSESDEPAPDAAPDAAADSSLR